MAKRNPKLVVDEIEHLVKRWGVREITSRRGFGNEDRIVELCDELVARKLDLVWALPNEAYQRDHGSPRLQWQIRLL